MRLLDGHRYTLAGRLLGNTILRGGEVLGFATPPVFSGLDDDGTAQIDVEFAQTTPPTFDTATLLSSAAFRNGVEVASGTTYRPTEGGRYEVRYTTDEGIAKFSLGFIVELDIEETVDLSSIVKGDVTFTLSTALPVGTYANGDKFVRATTGGEVSSIAPVGIVGTVDTDATETQPRDFAARHGARFNPLITDDDQGGDGRVLTGSNSIYTYDESLNDDPTASGAPISVATEGVIVKYVSELAESVPNSGNDQRSSGGGLTESAFASKEVLTVTGADVPLGGLRPPIMLADKTTKPNWTVGTIEANLFRFPRFLDLSGAANHTAAERDDRIARLSAIGHVETAEFLDLDTHAPRNSFRHYGGFWADEFGRLVMDMCDLAVTDEKRLEIAIVVAQLGLETWGGVKAGMKWSDNGAWYQGRMGAVATAAILLDDAVMMEEIITPDVNSRPPYNEQITFGIVSATARTDHGKGGDWGAYVGSSVYSPSGTINRQAHLPYFTSDIGQAVWGNELYSKPHTNSQATVAQSYKLNVAGSLMPQLIPLAAANSQFDMSAFVPMFRALTSQAQALARLDELGYPGDDVQYFAPNVGKAFGDVTVETANLVVDHISDQVIAHAQPAPMMPLPPRVRVFGKNVEVEHYPWEWTHGLPVTQIKTRWSQDDGATWTEITEAYVENHTTTFTATLDNTEVLVQTAWITSAGQGTWSINEPNQHPDETNGDTVPAAIEERGTVLATIADVVAPVLSLPENITLESTAVPSEIVFNVTTDEDNRTLYYVATDSATAPTAAQVVAGQDDTGAATTNGSSIVATTGEITVTLSGVPTGIDSYVYVVQEDVAGNLSDVAAIQGLTTGAGVEGFASGAFGDATDFTTPANMPISGGVLVINAPSGTETIQTEAGHFAALMPGQMHRVTATAQTPITDGEIRIQIDWFGTDDTSAPITGDDSNTFIRVKGSTFLASTLNGLEFDFVVPAGANFGRVRIVNIDAGTEVTINEVSISTSGASLIGAAPSAFNTFETNGAYLSRAGAISSQTAATKMLFAVRGLRTNGDNLGFLFEGEANHFEVSHAASTNQLRFDLAGNNVKFRMPSAFPGSGTEIDTFMITIDLSAATLAAAFVAYIGDTRLTTTTQETYSSGQSVDLSGVTELRLFDNGTGTREWVGDLDYIYFDSPATLPDLTLQSERDKFTDPALFNNGLGPTGSAPLELLVGPAADVNAGTNAGSNADYTVTGTALDI